MAFSFSRAISSSEIGTQLNKWLGETHAEKAGGMPSNRRLKAPTIPLFLTHMISIYCDLLCLHFRFLCLAVLTDHCGHNTFDHFGDHHGSVTFGASMVWLFHSFHTWTEKDR